MTISDGRHAVRGATELVGRSQVSASPRPSAAAETTAEAEVAEVAEGGGAFELVPTMIDHKYWDSPEHPGGPELVRTLRNQLGAAGEPSHGPCRHFDGPHHIS